MKSDLELIGAAYAKDSALVQQVEALIQNGEIDEEGARHLLTLIREGKLRSNCTHWYTEPICTRPHYPAWPSYPYWTSGTQFTLGSTSIVPKDNEVYTLT